MVERQISVASYCSALRVYQSCPPFLFLQLKSLLETKNIINAENGGYENVLEYISIAQPNASTITKIDALRPFATSGDRMVSSICLHVLRVISFFSYRCTNRRH